MTRFPFKTFLLAAALSAFACAATAQTVKDRPRDNNGPAAPSAAPTPNIVADAPSPRLAALIRQYGVIIRNKGVSSVTRIDTGVYCILPLASTGIKPATAIVIVSPEYFYSALNEVTVQWASTQSGCPSNRIGVYTFADLDANGIYSFSNLVGFSIIVP